MGIVYSAGRRSGGPQWRLQLQLRQTLRPWQRWRPNRQLRGDSSCEPLGGRMQTLGPGPALPKVASALPEQRLTLQWPRRDLAMRALALGLVLVTVMQAMVWRSGEAMAVCLTMDWALMGTRLARDLTGQ